MALAPMLARNCACGPEGPLIEPRRKGGLPWPGWGIDDGGMARRAQSAYEPETCEELVVFGCCVYFQFHLT